MKKTLLFFTLCLVCIFTNAQKIDKKLLIGKWELYSVQFQGKTLCRDSLPQYIDAMVQHAAKDAGPRTQAFSDDSLKYVKILRDRFTLMLDMYIKFEKKEDSSVLTYKERGLDEKTGPYKWIARNKISYERKGGANTEIWTILSLSATKLVLRFNEEKTSGTVNDITLTRAK